MPLINRLNMNPRAFAGASLLTVMVVSLVCSMSLQYGHADVPIAATADKIQPLMAGDRAPQFTLRTVDNEEFVFNPRELDRPAVIITFRGGWCPYCNMHLSELRHVVDEIDTLGVDVLFLSGDRPQLLYESLERETQDDIAGLGYTIYSDADAQAAIALGIAFRASQRTIDGRHAKGQDIEESSMLLHGVLPVPSVFAVGRDGLIAFAYSNADYKVRLPADELLQVSKGLVAAE
jgi:peroxiredoxin